VEYSSFLYVTILFRFASSLFLYKVYEAALLSLDNPLCVKVFYLPKENKKIFFSASLFYFFQNLTVH
jgi:hypothetical protein